VYQSMEAGKWLPHEAYLVSDSYPCVPIISGLAMLGTPVDLLKPVGPIYVHKDCSPPSQDIKVSSF